LLEPTPAPQYPSLLEELTAQPSLYPPPMTEADKARAADRVDRMTALGYFALGPIYYGGATDDEYDDRIDTLSRGFLGLTVACARCHDHKFDQIPTKDYYSLLGIFASTDYKEHALGSNGLID